MIPRLRPTSWTILTRRCPPTHHPSPSQVRSTSLHSTTARIRTVARARARRGLVPWQMYRAHPLSEKAVAGTLVFLLSRRRLIDGVACVRMVSLKDVSRAAQGACGISIEGGCAAYRYVLILVQIQKCDEEREGDSCKTCLRLRIQCLGWGPKRPEWMRVRVRRAADGAGGCGADRYPLRRLSRIKRRSQRTSPALRSSCREQG